MTASSAPTCVLFGRLQRDTIINASGQALIDQPGGNLLYAAAAFQVWGDAPGLVSRIGSDFPMDWERQLGTTQLDTRGVVRLAEPQDQRRFVAYSDVATAHRDNPVRYFARHNQPLPKSLLGYQPQAERLDSKRERNPLSLRPDDVPAAYRGTNAAHLCPLDYHSHKLLPAALRAQGTQLITLDAGRGYMQPDFLHEVPELVNGLTVFLTTEERLVTLFANRSQDTWKIIETLGSFNCKAVVVHSVHRGQWLLDVEAHRRYQIPPYPARVVDITNAGSSFCGGFIAGLLRTQDLLRATLYGNSLQSLAMEGTGAMYVSETLPGLAESRLNALGSAVQLI